MSQYDLTSVIAGNLDRHLVYPMLVFLESNKLYNSEDIAKQTYELVSKTGMVEEAIDRFKLLHSTAEVPAELKDKLDKTVEKLKNPPKEVEHILNIIATNENMLLHTKNSTMEMLREKHGVQPEMIDSLYDFAKYQFDCGKYMLACSNLYHFSTLSMDAEKCFNALWGKLACEILIHDWDGALEDVGKLKEAIDNKSFGSPLELLQQRTWLIHWSLFVFFQHPKGRDAIFDLFFHPPYLNTIQATSPHILRYLAVALIVNKKRKSLHDLVKLIQQESYQYRDPVTELLESLYIDSDFDAAQVKLRECTTLLQNDFFLHPFVKEFNDNARYNTFEAYCKIHQVISISQLAEKLNMSVDDAERWIVNLIRNSKFDAKIDSKEGNVIMGAQHVNVNQIVIDNTRLHFSLSQILDSAVTKKIQAAANAPPSLLGAAPISNLPKV